MHVLVRGGWQQRMRLGAGLILFAFASLHFFNTALALVSMSAVETFDHWRTSVTRSSIGTLVLSAALLVHIGLAFHKLAARSTLRLPRWELFQIATGVTIPLLLFPHIVNTRLAATMFGVYDTYPYEFVRLWQDSPYSQSFLLLLVWLHGCVGIHFWLRLTKGYYDVAPVLLVLATLLPAAGLAGFAAGGAAVSSISADPAAFAAFKASVNWPTDHLPALQSYREWTWYGYGCIVGLVAIVLLARSLRQVRRRRISIAYVGGPQVSTPVGLTLLEVSRANGVPHACVCGGRARCSTCRVQVVEGLESLGPPSAAERDTLASIRASADTRLACQIRVLEPARVLRIVTPGRTSQISKGEAMARQGEERTLAVLFFDLRGFTRMSNGRMNVRFETQRATQSGTVNETLELRINDELGERAYEMFSGGEAFRINFAVRIALSKLLAYRAGARLQTIFIDEGFGTQDTQGREALIDAINSVSKDFERIVIITHIDELKDAFPARIDITKTGAGSQIAVL